MDVTFWGPSFPTNEGHDANVLMNKLMRVHDIKAMYLAELQRAIDSASEPVGEATWMEAEIRRQLDLIDGAMREDPLKPYDNGPFDGSRGLMSASRRIASRSSAARWSAGPRTGCESVIGATVPRRGDAAAVGQERLRAPGFRAHPPDRLERQDLQLLRLVIQDAPVRALLLVRIQPLAVVAADALGHQDLRPLNRAPLAGLLAQPAGAALGPPLDLEDGEVRDDAERRRPPGTGTGSRAFRTNTLATSSTPTPIHIGVVPTSVNIQNGSTKR